jgi:hypothetical protein
MTIKRELPFAEYAKGHGLNWSKLKLMAKSPAHYHWALTQEYPVETDALLVGRAVHTAVLEPAKFARQYVTWNGAQRRGKEWEAFQAASAAVEILTLKQSLQVTLIANAVRRDPEAVRLLTAGEAEVTITNSISVPALGETLAATWPTKARLDYLGPRGIVDLKSCVDASPEGFGRAAWRLNYLGQAAWYVDAVERETGKAPDFTLVAVEKSAPYAVQVYRVNDELLEIGRDQYKGLLHRLAQCQQTNKWPGYVDGPSDLLVPRWALPEESEDANDMGINFTTNSEAHDGL